MSMPRNALTPILPVGWRRPPGFSHGLVGEGRVLMIAGQLAGITGVDAPPPGMNMATQFAASLANVVTVVREAGGQPEDIAVLNVFLTDMAAFKQAQPAVAAAWRTLLGRHFPTMTMVEVRALFEPSALVEINAMALLATKEVP